MPALRLPPHLFPMLRHAFEIATAEPANPANLIRQPVVERLRQEFALAEVAALPVLPVVMDLTGEEAAALALAFEAGAELANAIDEAAWAQIEALLDHANE